MNTQRFRDSGPNQYLPTPPPRNCPNVVQEHRIDRERAEHIHIGSALDQAHRDTMGGVALAFIVGIMALLALWGAITLADARCVGPCRAAMEQVAHPRGRL